MLATPERAQTAAAYLDAVRAILDPVRAAAPEIESARRLPPAVVEMIRGAGMFGVAVPRDWGGLELDAVTISEGIEILAAADASAAWCAMIGCDTGFASSHLDDATARDLWTDPLHASVFVANPTGTAVACEGGYTVTGRWTFASGSTHAPVYALACLTMTDSGPKMVTPTVPEVRMAVLPASQAEVIDTWTTTGLRGSGSHDVAVTGVFVPEGHTFLMAPSDVKREGPLWRYVMLFAAKLAPVGLGIARAAIDDVVGIAASKRALGDRAVIQDQQWLQLAVANAEVSLGQARAYYYECLGTLWYELLQGGMPSRESQAKLFASQIGAIERCVEVVDAMYKAAGSNALYARGSLDRRLRDIHTMSQHTACSPNWMAEMGQVFLGNHPNQSMLIR